MNTSRTRPIVACALVASFLFPIGIMADQDDFGSSRKPVIGEVHTPAEPGSHDIITITSKPSNALVYIDGVFMGKTPYGLKFPVGGRTCIILSKSGYHNATIEIAPGERNREITVEMIGLHFNESIFDTSSVKPAQCIPKNRSLRVTRFFSADVGSYVGFVSVPRLKTHWDNTGSHWQSSGREVTSNYLFVATALVGVHETTYWKWFHAGFGAWIMPGRILADGLHKDVANQRWWEMPWLLGPIVGIHFQTERWSPNLSFRFGFAEGGWGALGGEFPNVFLNPVAGFKLKLTSWLALGFDGGVLAIASNRKLQFKQDDPAPGYTRGGESYRGWEYGVVTFFGATINSSIVFYF